MEAADEARMIFDSMDKDRDGFVTRYVVCAVSGGGRGGGFLSLLPFHAHWERELRRC